MKTMPVRVTVAGIAAVILSLTASCAPTLADVLQENALLTSAKSASEKDDLMALEGMEMKALSAIDSDAVRQGDRLLLRLHSGASKVYEDRPECKKPDQETKCQKFRLIAHARSRGVFVVAKLYYESAEYLIVDDASGDGATLRRFPIFSPSGEHVVALLMNDEQLGFAVQVWRRDDHNFVLDWQGSPHADGMYTSYKLLRWLSENTIELQAETDFGLSKPHVTKRFSLHRAANGWGVVEVP
jgi:hypothetical protein